MRHFAKGDVRIGMIKSIGNGLIELRVPVGTDTLRLLFFLDSPLHAIGRKLE